MSQITTTIPPYTGTVPSKDTQTPTEFDSAVDELLQWWLELPVPMNTWGTEVNTVRDEVNNLRNETENLRDETQTLRDNTETLKNTVMASVNYVGEWSSGNDYTTGQSVSYSGLYYRVKADITNSTTPPPQDNTHFEASPLLPMSIGNIQNPLFEAQLLNSLAIQRGTGSITFQRASSASYIDRYGILKTVGNDIPRFENYQVKIYDGTTTSDWITRKGLLIEGSSTNLLLYSEDFSQSQWNKYQVTVQQSTAVLSPDGVSYAWEFIADTNSSHSCYQYVSSTETTATMSAFVKPGSTNVIGLGLIWWASGVVKGRIDYEFDLQNYTFIEYFKDSTIEFKHAEIIKLDNGWYRITLTAQYTGTDATDQIEGFFEDWITGDNSTVDFYVWGAQLEAMPFATSYIKTIDASATRANDNCYASYFDNMPDIRKAFSMVIDWNVIGRQPNARVIICTGQIYNPVRNLLVVYDNTARYYRNFDYNTFSYDSNNRTVVAVINDIVNVFNNGVKVIDNQLRELYNNNSPTSINKIGLGVRDDINYDWLYGHISNLRIYDRALTDQEAILA